MGIRSTCVGSYIIYFRDKDSTLEIVRGVRGDPRRDLSSQFDLEYEQAVFQWAAAQVRDSVSDNTWQSFWLTHVEGLSVDTAAKQLNMRAGTVYVARGRVMNRIKELVKQFEDKR